MASGGSVIALKYDGGVLMASDTLLSYGSLAKLPNIPRTKIVGHFTALCATGDYGDFQEAVNGLQQKIAGDGLLQDGIEMGPKEIFSYLHRTMYGQRSEFEPYLCQFVVCGQRNGESFLGAVDDIGTRWTDYTVATGYGAHIAIPLMRKALEVKNFKLTRDDALAVLQDCLRAVFYRECRAINRFQITEAANNKITISEPFMVDTTWDYKGFKFETTAIIR